MARRRLPGLSCEAPAVSAEPPASSLPRYSIGSGADPPPIPHVCLELHMVRVALRAGGPWLRHHEMCSKQAHPGRP